MEIYSSTNHPKVSSQMQVYSLKGHERPITTVKYNADGDLLFSASKDNVPSLWSSQNGERLGTYGHHKGAVWDLDVTWDSKYLITGCGDGNARLFETMTGKCLIRMPHRGAVRCVSWSEGSNLFLTASDPFKSQEPSLLNIFEFPSESDLQNIDEKEPNGIPSYAPKLEKQFDGADKITFAIWTYGNKYIIAGFDSGRISKFDSSDLSEVITKHDVHTDRINQLAFNKDKTLLITASKDLTAKVLDPLTLDVVRVFQTDRPVNGAVIAPTKPHVIIGGGQDAGAVTTTASQGKFESRFFHLVYGDEFGRMKGHFGPINALAIHPYGESFASGSEDGYIRLHHFDKNYLNTPDYLPVSAKAISSIQD